MSRGYVMFPWLFQFVFMIYSVCRHLMSRFSVLFIFLLVSSTVFSYETDDLKYEIEKYLKDKRAEVGVAVISDKGDTLTVNNSIRYPLMSVFKFHQALAVLNTLSANNCSLDSLLYISANDLLEDTYSPLRDKYPAGNINISVRDLLKYTLLLSDNNACDILFRRVVGVKETDDFIRSLGIDDFSIVANEDDMHTEMDMCYSNWSSPLSCAVLIDKLLNGEVLNGEYKSFVIDTMLECKTGENRLPAVSLERGTKIGHKTGTGATNKHGEIIAVNDIGFVLLPNRHKYSVAVLIKDSKESLHDTEKIISEISQMVYYDALKTYK